MLLKLIYGTIIWIIYYKKEFFSFIIRKDGRKPLCWVLILHLSSGNPRRFNWGSINILDLYCCCFCFVVEKKMVKRLHIHWRWSLRLRESNFRRRRRVIHSIDSNSCLRSINLIFKRNYLRWFGDPTRTRRFLSRVTWCIFFFFSFVLAFGPSPRMVVFLLI